MERFSKLKVRIPGARQLPNYTLSPPSTNLLTQQYLMSRVSEENWLCRGSELWRRRGEKKAPPEHQSILRTDPALPQEPRLRRALAMARQWALGRTMIHVESLRKAATTQQFFAAPSIYFAEKFFLVACE